MDKKENYIIDVENSMNDDDFSSRDTDEHFMNKLNDVLRPLASSNNGSSPKALSLSKPWTSSKALSPSNNGSSPKVLSQSNNGSSPKYLSSVKPWFSSRNMTNGSLNREMMNGNSGSEMINYMEKGDLRASNSPITLSRSSSDSSFENSEENVITENTLNQTTQCLKLLQNPIKTKKKLFRKLSFQEIERSLEIDTFDSSCKLSNELDIIITYLNGQKHLYLHSKIYTHFKLNLLMVPTLLISTLVTAVSQFIGTYQWSNVAIPILNATLTLLVSLVSYFKLESSSQIYANMATQYDKLQTVLEVANSRLIFLEDELEQHKLVVKTIQEFEIKIFEIKDSNTIFIPEKVKRKFPIISHINIFAFIKRIATYRKSLIYKYREAKNEMRYILYNIDDNVTVDERCKTRLIYLTDIKTKLRDELVEYKNAYSYMDDAFVQEIKNAGLAKLWFIPSVNKSKIHIIQHEIIKKHIPQF